MLNNCENLTMKFVRILLIFLYFTLCFLFKDNFEAQLALNSDITYNSYRTSIQNINYQDNSVLNQNNNQEITNIQNNSRNSNTLGNNKKCNLFISCNLFKNFSKHFSKNNVLSFNLENIIYTRAP